MSFLEEAIAALFPDIPVKLIQHHGSKLDYEVFVKRDKDGKVVGVVVSNEPGLNNGKREVKAPTVPEGKDHSFEKSSSVKIAKQAYNADKVKP